MSSRRHASSRRRLYRRVLKLAPSAALLLAGPLHAAQALGAPAAAGDAEAGSALRLTVSARPGHARQLVLASHVRAGAGAGARSVAFYVVSKEFKSPARVPIGTAKIEAGGAASLLYTPTWSGRVQFLAKLSGPGAHVPAASAFYDVSVSTPGPLFAGANPGKPLASASIVFLRVIQSLVALIWLGLIAVLVTMRVWMPRLGRGSTD